MIYKPTVHEELYQNPVGVPYGITWSSFYYRWGMSPGSTPGNSRCTAGAEIILSEINKGIT